MSSVGCWISTWASWTKVWRLWQKAADCEKKDLKESNPGKPGKPGNRVRKTFDLDMTSMSSRSQMTWVKLFLDQEIKQAGRSGGKKLSACHHHNHLQHSLWQLFLCQPCYRSSPSESQRSDVAACGAYGKAQSTGCYEAQRGPGPGLPGPTSMSASSATNATGSRREGREATLESLLRGIETDQLSINDALRSLEKLPMAETQTPSLKDTRVSPPATRQTQTQGAEATRCGQCPILGLQVRALAQSLSGLGASVVKWSDMFGSQQAERNSWHGLGVCSALETFRWTVGGSLSGIDTQLKWLDWLGRQALHWRCSMTHLTTPTCDKNGDLKQETLLWLQFCVHHNSWQWIFRWMQCGLRNQKRYCRQVCRRCQYFFTSVLPTRLAGTNP